MRLKISWFCQISTFACPEWSKLSSLGLIFIAIENFWILPNFILRMSRVVKNVCFKPNFQHDSKFLDFTKFHPLQVFYLSSQKVVLSQIFSATQNVWILPNFSLPRSRVVKITILSQILNKIENFLILPKFARRSGVVKNLIWAKFRARLKIPGFCQISYPSHVLSGQKTQFWAKFSTQQKIYGFC